MSNSGSLSLTSQTGVLIRSRIAQHAFLQKDIRGEIGQTSEPLSGEDGRR